MGIRIHWSYHGLSRKQHISAQHTSVKPGTTCLDCLEIPVTIILWLQTYYCSLVLSVVCKPASYCTISI